MAEAGTLHDAFIDELRDTYDAEKQLTKALPNWQRCRRTPSCVRRSRAILTRRKVRSSASSRCLRASTERCGKRWQAGRGSKRGLRQRKPAAGSRHFVECVMVLVQLPLPTTRRSLPARERSQADQNGRAGAQDRSNIRNEVAQRN